jgi:hypothetical protein
MRLLARGIAVLAVAATLTSCSGSTSTPRPTLSPGSQPPPAAQLAALANAGVSATYSAKYALRDAEGKQLGSVAVARTPRAQRFDFRIVHNGKATLASVWLTSKGSYACTPKHGKPLCLLLARRSGKAPGIFAAYEPLTDVFVDDLLALRTAAPATFTVTGLPPVAASNDMPAASCFTVRPTGTSTVVSGRYCLSAQGVPTSVAFSTGSSLLLQTYSAAVPAARRLVPPKHAIPVEPSKKK